MAKDLNDLNKKEESGIMDKFGYVTDAKGIQAEQSELAPLKKHVARTYLIFIIELAITGAIAWFLSTQPELLYTITSTLFAAAGIPAIILIFAVFALINRAMKTESVPLSLLFTLVIIAIIAVPLGAVPYLYEPFVVYEALGVTSIIYFTTAVYGLVTKKNYSTWGGPLLGALLALIVMIVISYFVQNSWLTIGILLATILIFTLYTIYDNQMIKVTFLAKYRDSEPDSNVSWWLLALSSAMDLYLDFINLFMAILRLLGNSRR
ncbi:Bax inhibitor-1 family protein [Lactobacillus sp. YT155]|uniref:Bax inhibitor-1/YccA family protein n=1 Tax=Lactobacillus sp. YT155 TaxID=3060955 RepID=UPI00265FD755|nr:Bax inhibitor-1 family protein [Lactobacillus sp. YT155]MDO1605832.1 Bax inhibitor-1 family protein [Lactobacillus sp. YT155]